MNNVKKHFSEGDIFLNQLVFKNFKDLFKKKNEIVCSVYNAYSALLLLRVFTASIRDIQKWSSFEL